MFWTDEKVKELIALTKSGLSFKAIGVALGCTKNAVIGKVHRLQIQDLQPVVKAWAVGKRSMGKPKAEAKENPPKPFRYKPRGPSIKVVMPVPKRHRGIHLLDLEPNHCRYPTGEGPNITFCGEPKLVGYSWCRSCKDVVIVCE